MPHTAGCQYDVLSIAEETPWSEAVSDVPHAYWHTWRANRALAEGGCIRVHLFVHREAGRIAVLPFAVRGDPGSEDVYTPAGFSGFAANAAHEAARRAWLEYVQEAGYVCGYFALHPVVAVSELHVDVSSRNELFLLNLRDGEETLLGKFDPDVRRRLRKWDESGNTPVLDRDALAEFLIRNYAAFMSDVKASRAAVWSQGTLRFLCEDPDVWLVGAKDDEGICAVAVFGASGTCAEYMANVRVRNGKAMSPLLLRAAVRHYRERGVPWLNLGGGVTANDSIARSKLRYDPKCVPLLAAREIYRPDEYARLSAAVRGHGNHSFFPAYGTLRACE